ncbi:MAG: hypothetical protein FWE69_04840 [Clostridiales bacterium]|nr:hypothetical protein [Clostridiales bacterium]
MGLYDDIQNEIQQRQDAKITLKEPMTIDEIYALMTQRWDTQKYGGFKLGKLLKLRWIDFDAYMMMWYGVQVTDAGTVVQVVPKPTNQSYSALPKAQKEQVKAVVNVRKAIDRAEIRKHEFAHLRLLCDAMREVLHDRII